jgi:hypothetical protein
MPCNYNRSDNHNCSTGDLPNNHDHIPERNKNCSKSRIEDFDDARCR